MTATAPTPGRRFDSARHLARRAAETAVRRGRLPRQDRDAAENFALWRLWQAARKFDPARHPHGESGWGAFATLACKRGVVDYVRAEVGRFGTRRGQVAAVPVQDVWGSGGWEPAAEDDHARLLEVREAVQTAVRRLPPRWGRVLAHIAAGATQADAARACGVHPTNACLTVRKALPLMREDLERMGYC